MRNHEAEAAADLLTPRQVAEALCQVGDLPELLREAGGALEAVGIICNHLEEACALCPDFEALARAIEANGAAREQLVAALTDIADFAGKTLLGPREEPEFDRGHQIGANKAFEECACIARAALAKVKGEQP